MAKKATAFVKNKFVAASKKAGPGMTSVVGQTNMMPAQMMDKHRVNVRFGTPPVRKAAEAALVAMHAKKSGC